MNARVRRVAHKAKMKEEDGTIFCNKACSSNRIASRVQDGNKSMVYMYNGGGVVDVNQSRLLGGAVVNCKSWRWVAWANASARLIGLASNQDLGIIDPRLATSEDDGSGSTSTAAPQGFIDVCQKALGPSAYTLGYILRPDAHENKECC